MLPDFRGLRSVGLGPSQAIQYQMSMHLRQGYLLLNPLFSQATHARMIFLFLCVLSLFLYCFTSSFFSLRAVHGPLLAGLGSKASIESLILYYRNDPLSIRGISQVKKKKSFIIQGRDSVYSMYAVGWLQMHSSSMVQEMVAAPEGITKGKLQSSQVAFPSFPGSTAFSALPSRASCYPSPRSSSSLSRSLCRSDIVAAAAHAAAHAAQGVMRQPCSPRRLHRPHPR